MKRHHLRPFGFFLGYLMHLYTILNIKVVYICFIDTTSTVSELQYYHTKIV
jgi:hypothetical protein